MHGVLVGAKVVPGVTSFDDGIIAALRDAGFDPRLPALPAVAPSTVRASYLVRAIEEVLRETGAPKVLIVAHSQGGIDARLVATVERLRDKIAGIVTLSTPHQGTPLAEIGEKLYGSLVETIMNRASRRIAESRGWYGREGQARALIASLTPREMQRLTVLATPVPIYSLAGTPEPASDGSCEGGRWPTPRRRGVRHPFMRIGGAILDDSLGPGHAHDGLVPTANQRFGEFLGCASVDHLGWLQARTAGLDVAAFLVELVRGLDDVRRSGDPRAMDAHAPSLARLVGGTR